MAQFTVTNLDDAGAGSLRQAILDANATVGVADIILFQAGLAGTITLTETNGALAITDDLTIDGDNTGDNKADITISGGGVTGIISQAGTGLDLELKSLTLTNGNSGYGGGIYVTDLFNGGSTLKISDTTIQNCFGTAGGGLAIRATIATITNSLISGNYSQSSGGGILHSGASQTTLVNTTITGNTSFNGGSGIDARALSPGPERKLTLINSTVTGNDTKADGSRSAGIDVDNVVLSVTNSVVAENRANIDGTPFFRDISTAVDVANNSVFGTDVTIVSGSGNQEQVANIGLGALGDHGGTTQTRDIQVGSPLFDAGSNAGAAGIATDANGNARFAGGIVDVGATEFRQIVVTTLADVVNAGDGVISLREAVALANADSGLDVIGFNAGLSGQVTLGALGELQITGRLILHGDTNGDHKADIAISGNNARRVLNLTTADADIDLRSLTLANGRALGGEGGGAILAAAGADLTLSHTTLRANTAGGSGGAILMQGGLLSAVNTTISGNTAGGYGGGVYAANGTALLTNTTVSGNTANLLGGGISANASTITLNTSTVTANRADADGTATTNGGGIDSFGGTLTVINTAVADNFSGNGSAEHDVSGDVATATNSAFGAGTTILAGAGNLVVLGSAGLGGLLDNGGTTLTRSPLDGSVLIGAGAAASLPLDVFDLDRDGDRTEVLPRDGRNGARVAGAAVDIGAVEQVADEAIGGTDGADILVGGLGNDVLRGRAGADTLNGGSGADTADWTDATAAIVFTLAANGGGVTANVAGIGIDTLIAIENLTGGGAGDTLTGNASNNVLGGGAGRDTLRGGLGVDTIRGGDEAGAGDILLSGEGSDDRIFGGGGNDRIDGGADGDSALNGEAGNDVIAAGDGLDQANGGDGDDIVYGQAGRDTLRGGLGADTLYGGDEVGLGDIVLNGEGGNDHIQGGLGDDRIDGGDDNDKLFGEAGDDIVNGGFGADRLEGGANADVLRGQEGNDVMVGGTGADTLYAGAGIDNLFGNDGDDFLQGDAQNDNLTGGTGLDRFNFDLANGSDAIFDFVNDQDTLIIDPGFGFANAAAVVAATIQTGNHARILLPGADTDIFLWDYLAPGSGNSIGNLIDDISIG